MTKEEKEAKEKIIEGETSGTDYDYRYLRHRHHGGYVGALILIFIGVIFLLNNLNLLSWEIWNQLLKFWPIIIILIGIQMLLGKSSASRFLVALITLFLLAGVLAYIFFSNGLLVYPPRL